MTDVPPANSMPSGMPLVKSTNRPAATMTSPTAPIACQRHRRKSKLVFLKICMGRPAQMLNVATCRRRASASSNSVFDTNVDVNRFDSRPTASVTAKPRIGPVPNLNRNAAEMSAAMCVSTSVRKTRLKPALIAARTPRSGLELLLDALEDQHVRVDADAHRQHEAGDAGQRHHRADVGHQAEQDDQVEEQGDDRVHARQLVVDEHEDDDQQQADERRDDAGADRIGAERRTDRPLLQVVHARRQRARPQDQRQVLRFLLREAAVDPPVGRDAAVDARRRLHATVEHDRELAADVVRR